MTMTKEELEGLIREILRLRAALQYYADNGGHVAKTALGYYEKEVE